MIQNQATGKACSECWGLRNGTRSNQDPHEYLLPFGHVESGTTVSYRCLLCKSELIRQVEGLLTHWR
jgi:hypothetical protein